MAGDLKLGVLAASVLHARPITGFRDMGAEVIDHVLMSPAYFRPLKGGLCNGFASQLSLKGLEPLVCVFEFLGL